MSWAADLEERLCQWAWRIVAEESLGSEAQGNVIVVLNRGLSCIEARIHAGTSERPGRWLTSVGYDPLDKSYYRVRREDAQP